MDNVHVGLCLVDSDLNVCDGYSRELSSILDCDHATIAGKNLLELIGLGKKEANHYESIFNSACEESYLSDFYLSQLPNNIWVKDKCLRITASPILNQDGEIESVLFNIIDNTEKLQAEREIQDNRALIKILQNKDKFKLVIQEIRREIGSKTKIAKLNTSQIQRLVHTLKGNLGQFDLVELVRILHEIEERASFSTEEIVDFHRIFEEKLAEVETVSGARFRDDSTMNVYPTPESDIERLLTLCNKSHREKDKVKLHDEIALLKSYPFVWMTGNLEKLTESIAKRLGKKVRLVLIGGDTHIHASLAPLCHSLVHAVRNAIDHGIEKPEDRKDKGTALITVAAARNPTEYSFEIADNGNGLNLDRIRQLTIAKGIYSEQELDKLPPESVADMVFHPNFSTAAEVSDVSGRGVGMSAIKEEVEKMQGTLMLENKPSEGLKLIISIPLESCLAETSFEPTRLIS